MKKYNIVFAALSLFVLGGVSKKHCHQNMFWHRRYKSLNRL